MLLIDIKKKVSIRNNYFLSISGAIKVTKLERILILKLIHKVAKLSPNWLALRRGGGGWMSWNKDGSRNPVPLLFLLMFPSQEDLIFNRGERSGRIDTLPKCPFFFSKPRGKQGASHLTSRELQALSSTVWSLVTTWKTDFQELGDRVAASYCTNF